MDGWLPIPSAQASRDKEGGCNDPAVSSIRVLGALPTHGLQTWLHGQMGWGETRSAGLGQGRVGERRRGRCCVVRQDACWLVVGWALVQHTTVENDKMCILPCMLSPS